MIMRLLNIYITIICGIYLNIPGFQWLKQVHQYQYLQDYRRPFRNYMQNEKVIVDRLAMANRGHIDAFVKSLRVILVYGLFYKKNPPAKKFRIYVD